ncbi:PH domain-containing protein [Arthrobacter sp. A5]|uniref:PH domain-containing protein n=1 Tax=Arthrobacter sp. A5 TaxID=576926 RepID=UPI003DA985CA
MSAAKGYDDGGAVAPQSNPPGPAVGFRTGPEDQWRRVHPVSPLVRGWLAVVGLIVVFGRNSFDDLVQAIGTGGRHRPGGAPVWLILSVLAAAVVIFAVVFFLSWFYTRYQVTDDHVRVNSGVIFRQQRQARIDRVQAIDVVQPLLARIFSLAELKFEVADAGKSAMKLSFLNLDEAKRLRAAILARASGMRVDPDQPSAISEAPEREVLALTPGRIAGATLLSGITVAALVLTALVVGALLGTGSPALLVVFIPLLLAVGAAYWKAFTTDCNFRVAVSPDGVRLHYGLLDTRAQTIPPGRVQAVGVTQSPLWRLTGWYRVHVNVAGYGADHGDSGGRTVVLPAGTEAEVMTVLGLIFPDPGVADPVRVFTAGLRGKGRDQGFIHSPRRARLLDPFAWRRNAYRATDTALLCRHGLLFRRLQVVPHERTQSLSLFQGPLMRRLGLVDFELHSTAGPVRPMVHHLDLVSARELFTGQAARAASARRSGRPERWMEERPAGPDLAGAAPPSSADKDNQYEQ